MLIDGLRDEYSSTYSGSYPEIGPPPRLWKRGESYQNVALGHGRENPHMHGLYVSSLDGRIGVLNAPEETKTCLAVRMLAHAFENINGD